MSSTMNTVIRFFWYFFSRLLKWAIAISFVFLAFFMAMDYMNVQTLTKDGLHVRAQVIIKGNDPTTLSNVFTKSFLEQDDMLDSDLYQSFNVSDFDYNADIGFALIFPWQNEVILRVEEKVTNINAEPYSTENTDADEEVPAWDNAVYNVTLVRYEDNWRVSAMEYVEPLPAPSPTPSPSPSPAGSPSAAVSGSSS